MKRAGLYLIVIVILTVTGCAKFRFSHPNDQSYIDALIKAEEYDIALRFIDNQERDVPGSRQLQRQRPLIIKKAQRYEKRVLIQAGKLAKTAQYADAIELLEEALQHLPSSKNLQQEIKKQQRQRREPITELQYQIAIHKARAIKEEQRLYQRLYKLDPASTSVTPRSMQWQAESIVRELLKWAKHYITTSDNNRAHKAMTLAKEIVPTIEQTSEFREMLQKIKVQERGNSQVVKRKRKVALERNVQKFNHQFEQKKLFEAQATLKDIETSFARKNIVVRVVALRKKLNRAVSREVEQHMESGQLFYSREQIEEAIKEWRQALRLAPDNKEAREHISRAEKVLQQLQRVRQNRRH